MPVTVTTVQINMKEETANTVDEVLGKGAYNTLLSIATILSKQKADKMFFDFSNGRELIRMY